MSTTRLYLNTKRMCCRFYSWHISIKSIIRIIGYLNSSTRGHGNILTSFKGVDPDWFWSIQVCIHRDDGVVIRCVPLRTVIDFDDSSRFSFKNNRRCGLIIGASIILLKVPSWITLKIVNIILIVDCTLCSFTLQAQDSFLSWATLVAQLISI